MLVLVCSLAGFQLHVRHKATCCQGNHILVYKVLIRTYSLKSSYWSGMLCASTGCKCRCEITNCTHVRSSSVHSCMHGHSMWPTLLYVVHVARVFCVYMCMYMCMWVITIPVTDQDARGYGCFDSSCVVLMVSMFV